MWADAQQMVAHAIIFTRADDPAGTVYIPLWVAFALLVTETDMFHFFPLWDPKKFVRYAADIQDMINKIVTVTVMKLR